MTGRARVALGAAFGAVYLVWGSTYLAIAWAVESVPPLLMIGGRCLLAGVVLYTMALWRGGVRPGPRDWLWALEGGVLLFVTGQAALAWAETRIPSGAASLLVATEPLFITLLSWRAGWLVGGPRRPPSRWALVAVALGFIGVAVLVLPGGGGVRLDPLGAGAAVAASLSWSVGVLRTRPRPGLGAAQRAAMQLLAAGAVLLVLAPLLGEGPAAVRPTARSLVAFGYLVVFGSVVTYGAYVWLLERVGAPRLSSHAYVNPLVAVVLGASLNGESLGLAGGLASGLIVGSVAVLLRSGAEAPPGAAQSEKPVRANRQRAARKPAAEIARSQT